MYALALKEKTSPDLLIAFSSSLTPQSFNPRGIDTHFIVVLLDTIWYTCRDLGFTNLSIRNQCLGVAKTKPASKITQPNTLAWTSKSRRGQASPKLMPRRQHQRLGIHSAFRTHA
ncbi:hypothetical protein PIB30_076566 [Stylosanthes scabra]|uniref:Uncharacterized protein n=1 Tax=Stylosanthes scabra TaxID=79078 RepID=A0ABU6QQV1_9FABA|nr:hypothetical protein [Stylosanthes scabra]